MRQLFFFLIMPYYIVLRKKLCFFNEKRINSLLGNKPSQGISRIEFFFAQIRPVSFKMKKAELWQSRNLCLFWKWKHGIAIND